jgi:hypothetical protein
MALIDIHAYRLPPDNTRALAFVQQFMDMVIGNLQRMRALGPIDGVLLKNQVLGGTAKRLVHGLGRLPNGWILARQNTNTTVWETAVDADSITLQAGATCTVGVWVF